MKGYQSTASAHRRTSRRVSTQDSAVFRVTNQIRTDGANGLETALRELAEISNNLEVAVTELDVVGSDPPTYWKAVQACYHVPRCVGVTTWEVRDEPASNPIDTPNKALFKVNYDPKDAYYQIRDELINLKKSQL
jgi:endo-1,4-beta-xylanase